jgi:diacylglycerol kinase family enzyme
MNPRSGGGKVERFRLAEKAAALGAEVSLLDVSHPVDVAALAQDAVQRGADLLGVAGGDGTQALVAAVAAEHDVPLMVISAGTRNHFALDLGLDRTDPSRCLDALSDGVELRVDLGQIGGRPFVNNASFGAYAEIVRDPAYRDDKVRITLARLPDLLLGEQPGRLHAVIDGGHRLESPQALLVSNNPYETEDIAGLSRRARLDTGRLGVAAIRVANARQAVGLLSRTHAEGLTLCTAAEVVVDAEVSRVPVGIDGETVMMPVPVRCTVRPGALRVRVPRNRPGVPPPRAAVHWSRLRRLAFGRGAVSVPEQLESQLDGTPWRPVRPRRPGESSSVDPARR